MPTRSRHTQNRPPPMNDPEDRPRLPSRQAHHQNFTSLPFDKFWVWLREARGLIGPCLPPSAQKKKRKENARCVGRRMMIFGFHGLFGGCFGHRLTPQSSSPPAGKRRKLVLTRSVSGIGENKKSEIFKSQSCFLESRSWIYLSGRR